jgi:transposase
MPTVQTEWTAYVDEIRELITRSQEPMKAKTAFLTIKEAHSLPGSYETFKIIARRHRLHSAARKPTVRLESAPGEETQIDYGLVGYHVDPSSGKRRKVYAFCAKLSFSRMQFIEFVYTQSQESWVESHGRMGEFFGGFTKYITIDNLKAAVIKADRYDPELNRAYRDFAEYHGVFINTCIPAHAKGKGKVERMVPPARELYRRLHHLNPHAALKELSLLAGRKCREEYGNSRHGTTKVPPNRLFEEQERGTLISLPQVRFEVPTWRKVTVHADQFFTFDGRRYGMPVQWRNRSLYASKSREILRIFGPNHELIREYVINGKPSQWLPGDFPETSEALLKGEYPEYLRRQASALGLSALKLIDAVLKPHAYLNARKARGILTVLGKNSSAPFLQELCQKALEKKIFTPLQIEKMIDAESKQGYFEFITPTSEAGKAMVRNVLEYFN